MKIFDCFMYFNEEILLNLRLNILDKYVDYFVMLKVASHTKVIRGVFNLIVKNSKSSKKRLFIWYTIIDLKILKRF